MNSSTPDIAALIAEARARVEEVKHWNEDCGWDVPAIDVVTLLDTLEALSQSPAQPSVGDSELLALAKRLIPGIQHRSYREQTNDAIEWNAALLAHTTTPADDDVDPLYGDQPWLPEPVPGSSREQSEAVSQMIRKLRRVEEFGRVSIGADSAAAIADVLDTVVALTPPVLAACITREQTEVWLAEDNHALSCPSIQWGWDGVEGDSGEPCDCYLAVLALPPVSVLAAPAQQWNPKTYPHVAIEFDGGTTFALTGANAGRWVEGAPTHAPVVPPAQPSVEVIAEQIADGEELTLDSMAETLVRIVGGHKGPLTKIAALTEAAKELRVGLSQMFYVLTYARSLGLVQTNSVDSTIRLPETEYVPGHTPKVTAEQIAAVQRISDFLKHWYDVGSPYGDPIFSLGRMVDNEATEFTLLHSDLTAILALTPNGDHVATDDDSRVWHLTVEAAFAGAAERATGFAEGWFAVSVEHINGQDINPIDGSPLAPPAQPTTTTEGETNADH